MHLEALESLIRRHARPDMTTSIDGVLLARESHSGTVPSMTGAVVAVIAQGRKHIALGDRVYDYGPGQVLTASLDLPVSGRFVDASPENPALGFGLVLQPALIAELLLQAGPWTGNVTSGGAAPPGMAVSDASPELLDAVVRLVRLLDTPRDAAVLAPIYKRELLWRLITGDQGGALRQLGLADSHVSRISRAVRWIREHYAAPFRVEDLAKSVGMSTSAFHRNFQAVTALSPIQFQKQIRLQEARLLLMTRTRDISTVAFQVGYESPSQFSREYRRLFSKAPSAEAA